MPPFQYPEIHPSPYAGSIADILLRKGDIAAHAAESIGAAQAGAAAASGQAWGGAIQSGSQQIAGGLAKANDPKEVLARQQVTDLRTLDAAFAKPGGRDAILAALPGHLQGQVAKQFSDADESAAKFQETQLATEKATNDYTVNLAEGIKAHGYDPTAAQLAIAHAKQTFVRNTSLMGQVTQLEQALHANPTSEGVRAMVDPIIAAKEAQEKAIILPGAPRPGAAPSTLVTPSGIIKATGASAGPAAPTPSSIAIGAAEGDPTMAAAQELMKPPKPEPPPRSLSEQLLEAVAGGDATKANQITRTLTMEANARKDPAAAASALATRTLSQQLAQARLDTLQEKNKPLDISGNVNTTMGGRKYIDVSEWQTPEDRAKAQHAATEQGIMPVNKDTASMLSDLDTARQNQQTMMKLIESKLPKDAAGRFLKGPANKLEALMQSDSDLASMGTFRNAAIQSMRAVAGSKGLRINQAEVQLAIDNDIPKLSDTLDTAKQKLANLSAFMDNVEKSHLVRDRSAVTGGRPTTTPSDPLGIR